MNKNTEIYLTGKTAYRREYGSAITRCKKSEFASLFTNREKATVYLDNTTAKKYAVAILRLGFILKAKEAYDSYTTKIVVEAL